MNYLAINSDLLAKMWWSKPETQLLSFLLWTVFFGTRSSKSLPSIRTTEFLSSFFYHFLQCFLFAHYSTWPILWISLHQIVPKKSGFPGGFSFPTFRPFPPPLRWRANLQWHLAGSSGPKNQLITGYNSTYFGVKELHWNQKKKSAIKKRVIYNTIIYNDRGPLGWNIPKRSEKPPVLWRKSFPWRHICDMFQGSVGNLRSGRPFCLEMCDISTCNLISNWGWGGMLVNTLSSEENKSFHIFSYHFIIWFITILMMAYFNP